MISVSGMLHKGINILSYVYFVSQIRWYIKSVPGSGVNSKLFIFMSIIPIVLIYNHGVLNTSLLPKYFPSLSRMLRVTKPPPNPPNMRSKQGTIFLDDHFKNHYPSSSI